MNFNNNNNFSTTKCDFTSTLQKEPRKNINGNQFIRSKYMKWKHFCHNPTPPTVRDLIEILEITTTIKPIVNSINAPAYKHPTLSANNLETYILLPSVSNVKSTMQLVYDLLAIPHNKDRKLSRIRVFPSKN